MDGAQQWHRHFAVEMYNASWDLLGRTDRSPDDDAALMAAAFGSAAHWDHIGTDENRAIGDHQIAKAAGAVGLPDVAVVYARRALDRVERGGLPDWLLAAAHEGMARACAVAGDAEGRAHWIEQCTRTLAAVTDPDDRAVVADQLRTVPEIEISG